MRIARSSRIKPIAVLVLAMCLTMGAVQASWAAAYDFGSNFGKISRLYPTTNRTYFSLKDGQTAMNPQDGYYFIPTTHSNYRALIDLLYTATVQGWVIHARTNPQLQNGFAEVLYLVVDR